MRKRKALTAVLAVTLSGVTVMVSSPAHASSHREAPLIAQDPVADNTDVYLFRDVNDPTMVDIVANFIGLEDPAAGPNFARFGDDVLYEIHVDNDHDVVADITFQFRFRTIVGNADTFLYNTNTIDPTTYDELNVRQVYSVRRIEDGVSTMLASNVETPPVNVGPRSTPNYESYTDTALTPLDDDAGMVFAGQRDDAFFADLGSIFDLLGLRPINAAHVAQLPAEDGVDGLFQKSVHTISLQLPIASLTRTGTVPVVVDSKDSVIGVYASSSRQRVKVLSARGGAPRNLGQYVQVSRLGIPLVNEVLIPLGDKDRWNGTDPKDDDRFADSLLDPEPTRLLPVLYPDVFDNTNTPPGGAANRPDLVKLLDGELLGLTGDNVLPVADLLRINLAQLPVEGTVDNRMGALAADPGGFPNGRRLTDDVVDIELQVLAGILLDDDGFIDDGDQVPWSALGDGVDHADEPLLDTFPYQGTPVSGYDQSGDPSPCPAARSPRVC